MRSRRNEPPRKYFLDPNENELQYPSLEVQSGESKCSKSSCQIGQIEFKMNKKWWNSFLPVKNALH